MTTTARRQTPAQARKSAVESDFTPLYAVAGLTDAVAETLKQTLTSTQQRAAQRVADLQGRRPSLEAQAKASAEELTRFVRSLPVQVKALPETTRTKIADLQKQAGQLLTEANSAYVDLAGRGKKIVDATVISARTLSGKAERRTEDAFADVADKVDPVFAGVQEAVTVARKTVTGRTATETVTPRSAAKGAATRKAAAKKAPVRKAAAKKTPASQS